VDLPGSIPVGIPAALPVGTPVTSSRFKRSSERPPLLSVQTVTQLRWWSTSQRVVAAVVFVVVFVVIGEVGQTLPPANVRRMYPVEWWNWVTLAVSAVSAVSAALIGLGLIGLIVATFVRQGGRRARAGAGSGSAGTGLANHERRRGRLRRQLKA